MSRFELGGHEGPIPTIALPDPNLDDNLPPQVFLLQDGVPFVKTDWVGLGYTHYEVWCVGGAGGYGGSESNNLFWRATRVRPVMNATDWANYLNLMVYYAAQLIPPYGPYGGTEAATRAYYEAQFPNHDPWYVSTFFDAFLQDNAWRGGAGGGGGVEVAVGLLADLADATDVEVGSAGANAEAGQTTQHGLWTPAAYDASFGTPLQQWATEWMNEYPLPHKQFAEPAAGGAGGASTFGGDICQASGGEGGEPYKVWDGSQFVFAGDGGDGGIGGRTAPGGGASGASDFGVSGSDGGWDGTIGEGGGGGHSGKPGQLDNPSTFPNEAIEVTLPTDGGRGAFSYADTSVFGAREQKHIGYQRVRQVDYYTGAITSDTLVASTIPVEAGGGGGVVANQNLPYGSRAVGFNPNGAVIIRLTAIT